MFGCHDAKVAKGELDCCEKKMAKMPTEQQQTDCPDCQSKYISLDADYLLMPVDFKINLPLASVFQSVIPSLEKFNSLKNTTTWENDLPPPPYGKTLLPHIQSFLC
jgi:hypothetical protein